jgi:ABC-type Fe3+ transport system permease subunit
MQIAAVDISDSLQRALDDLIGFLPRLIGFLIVLLIGFLVAKAIQKLVTVALEKVGTDRALRSGRGGEYVQRAAPDVSPSDVIGRVVFWFIFLGALSIAISSLGISALNEFVADVFNYLPNVVVAILIAVVAIPIAGGLAKLAERTWADSPMGKMLGTAIPALVLGIAVFMILNQLRIATDIVVITYAALMGAIALGAALAFGLGGRDVASRMLEDTYRRGQAERARARAAGVSQETPPTPRETPPGS